MEIVFDTLLSPVFNYKTFLLGDVKYGVGFQVIHVGGNDDIFVHGERTGMTLTEKYAALKNCDGIIHSSTGVSYGILNKTVKWIQLKGESATSLKEISGEEVQRRLGEPDCILTDGIQFGPDFVVDEVVMIYERLKLHVFVDQESDLVSGVAFGDINADRYDEVI
jgi:hypothetical protein